MPGLSMTDNPKKEVSISGEEIVLATVNGQQYRLKPNEVILHFNKGLCSITVASTFIQFHSRMVFYLHCNRTEQGICQFYLYAHNFTAIQILHSDDGLYKLTRQFSESVKQSPKTEVLNLYEGLEDIGVNDFERIMLKDPGHWRISHINKDFQVCPTYPSAIVVPANVSDSVLRHAAKFRSRNRLPILSYSHGDATSIFRSSQAMVGLQRHRSLQDERLIEAIRHTCPRKMLMIVDARPSKSAMANAVSGGGSMPLENYSECERLYLGIENIHSVRSSYLKVFEYLIEGKPLRSAKIEAGWVKHFETIMEGVRLVTAHMQMGMSVLVHCSDGWDRTAQLVSLSQICLDPYTRTIEGFLALVQREWVLAGHRFETRLARSFTINTLHKDHGNSLSRVFDNLTRSKSSEDKLLENPSEEFCPIFIQFLDALSQMLRVYPNHFEFDYKLIDELWREVYILECDTFKGDNEFERYKMKSQTNSCSCFYKRILSKREDYLNPLFKDSQDILEITNDLLFYL